MDISPERLSNRGGEKAAMKIHSSKFVLRCRRVHSAFARV
jgi:hypothetical protein